MDVFTYIKKNGKDFFKWGLTKNEQSPGEGSTPGNGPYNAAPYETWYDSEDKKTKRIKLWMLLEKIKRR